MKPKYKVGDSVMITTESLRGREGVITRILDENLQDNPNGSTFIIENGDTVQGYTMNALQFELINHAEDEKNETGYYSEAAHEMLSKKPIYRPGDVIHVKNDMGGIFYVIEESTLVEHNIRGGLYPVYQYTINLLDDGTGHFKPDRGMCEEGDIEFQYHDKQWEEYFTEAAGYSLPKWRGNFYNYFALCKEIGYEDDDLDKKFCEDYNNDTIPPACMQHILKDHSIFARIDTVINNNKKNIMNSMGITNPAEISEIARSIKRKFKYRNRTGAEGILTAVELTQGNENYTPKELALVDEIDALDKDSKGQIQDHYPVKMTHVQIMEAIKEAYENARKSGGRCMSSEPDKRHPEEGDITPIKGVGEYEGESPTHGLTIRILYNHDLNYIDTAFPLRMNNNAKKH